MRVATLAALMLAFAACGDSKSENNGATPNGASNNTIGLVDAGDPDAGGSPDSALGECDETVEGAPAPIGGDRPAKVVLPRDWTPCGTYPVVVLLHGITSNSTVANLFFRTTLLVDEYQFVLVLAEGTKTSTGVTFWNGTECCDVEASGVDDSGYLIELGEEAVELYGKSPDQLYYVGQSNGGFMSYRLACDHSDRIAGIASFSGLSWANAEDCGNPEPVTVVHIHGTADTTVPYEGGLTFDVVLPSATEVVERWAERNGCDNESVFLGYANYESGVSGEETRKEAYRNCEDGTEVQLWTMVGSPHVPTIDDKVTRDILEYLFAHPRQ